MSNFDKVQKIVNSLTSSTSNNKGIIIKNKKIILKKCKKTILHDLIINNVDGNKIIEFMDTLYNLPADYNMFLDEISKNTIKGNNTFLHTAVTHGLDYNFFVKLNRKFGKSPFYMDLINRENSIGDTFVHVFLGRNHIDYKYLIEFITSLSQANYNFYLDGSEGISLLECLDLMVDKDHPEHYSYGITKNIKVGMPEEKLYSLKKQIYDDNFLYFLEELSYCDNLENIRLIKNIYGSLSYCDDSGSLLHRTISSMDLTQKNYMDSTTTFIGFCIKKLLEAGVSPNFKDKYDRSFLELLKNNWEDNRIDILKRGIEASLEYGFDVNKFPDFMGTTLKEFGTSIDTADIFELLINNGYDPRYSNLDRDRIVFSVPRKGNLSVGEGFPKMLKLYNQLQEIDKLITHLELRDLEVEDKFIPKLIFIYKEYDGTMHMLNNLLGNKENNKEKFIQNLVESIIEYRCKSINIVDEKVSVIELMDVMKEMMIELKNKKINDIEYYKIKVKDFNNN